MAKSVDGFIRRPLRDAPGTGILREPGDNESVDIASLPREPFGKAGDGLSLKNRVPHGFIYFASCRMMPTVYRGPNAAGERIPHILPRSAYSSSSA
jgi:hypothetical protein